MPAELTQELFPLLNTHFVKPLCQRIQAAAHMLEAMAPQATLDLNEPAALLRLAQQQQADLPLPPTEPTPDFTHYFSVLLPAFETWLSSKPELIEEEQSEERFRGLEGDPIGLRIAKSTKSVAHSLYKLPSHVNKRVSPDSRPARRWKHRIPWRNMLRQHVMVYLLRELKPLVQSAEQLQQQLYTAAREASEQAHRHYTDGQPKRSELEVAEKQKAEWDSLLAKSRELQRYIEGESRVILRHLNAHVLKDYPKAGTFELSELEFSRWRTEKFHRQELDELNSIWQEWQQARRALISQWHMRMAVYATVYRWQLETSQLRLSIATGLSAEFWPAFAKISEVLTSLKKLVAQHGNAQHGDAPHGNAQHGNAPQDLSEALSQARHEVRQQLHTDRIREIVAGLVSQDLAGKVKRLEQGLATAIQDLPEQTTVAKNGKVSEPLRQAELATIQPRQLVTLEVLPKAENELTGLKIGIVQGVEEARERLLEMEDVCLFNLESAEAYLLDHPDEQAKARAIAFEGLDRTINQTRQVEQRLRNLEKNVPQEIEGILNQLYQDLLSLRSADNLWSLQLRLLKAKAIQRSGNLLDNLEARFGTKIPGVLKQLEVGMRWTRDQQTQLRSKLGLEAAPPSIATEVTDFLQENEVAQQKLPFVYRRLYNTEPLHEELFFVGRKPEIASLQNTYNRWKEGRYAALLVTGERGSGLSSLFNIFIKQLPPKQKVVRLQLPLHPSHPSDLYDAITRAFNVPSVGSLPEIIDGLKALSEPIVVLAEDIQRLMLRKVGGFAYLKELFAIVAATNRKLCWIGSCNLYAWQYLNRAIGGTDSWAQTMTMQPFTRDQLLSLIMQRHRVSGYQLVFEPAEHELKSKKFQALEYTAQQKQLEDKFFYKLAAFSQSNLRLALLYWLRATLSVSKNTITISTSLNPEFGFLNSLSTEKYFTLYQLLLHDYLPTNAYAELQNMPAPAGKHQLQSLYDVGLLVQRPELGYSVNPLLYRQIVNVLKQRNLIH